MQSQRHESTNRIEEKKRGRFTHFSRPQEAERVVAVLQDYRRRVADQGVALRLEGAHLWFGRRGAESWPLHGLRSNHNPLCHAQARFPLLPQQEEVIFGSRSLAPGAKRPRLRALVSIRGGSKTSG